jgi:acetyl coenzyme A synthetase (ADP forming)-like protein
MTDGLTGLLEPRSVAVVGASPKPGSVAGTILKNLQDCGYHGDLYPVNPKYDEVLGLRCRPTIASLPPDVDLAVLAINRNGVLPAVEECGRAGISNLVIITAGFKETGEEGAKLEEELRHLIGRYELNVVGPNCMGIINSSERMKLNASFSRWFPPGGGIAFVSQSGSLGETLLECFGGAGLGVSQFVNLGNRAGLTENDFLAYFAENDQCSAIFLYLESFSDPREFRRLVTRIGKTKPVVVLKAGRTEVGAAAVASHTGSLASPDTIVDAFLRQCGALRVGTIEETLAALRALERGILPAGERVAILTNAGGAGIIAADACVREGLKVFHPSDPLREKLAEFLPPEAGLGNPVDMIATASSEHYEKGLDLLLEEADSAIVVFRPPLVFREPVEAVSAGILRVAAKKADKPIFFCSLSHSEAVAPLTALLRSAAIPTYAMPETAVAALSMLCRARDLRHGGGSRTAESPADQGRAGRILDRVRREGRIGLFFDEGAEFLAAYGISVCPYAYLGTAREGARFLAHVGPPLVLKVDAPGLEHRYELDAVVTGIETARGLREAFEQLRRTIGSHDLKGARLLAQKMVSGRELIFGLEKDPAFGPAVMFGIGGTLVEALNDVSFGVAPISDVQAERMIRSIRAFPLLETFRGRPAVSLPSLIRIVSALGQIGVDFPEIAEIDLNPVLADERGAIAVDLLIRLSEDSTTYLRVQPVDLPRERDHLADVPDAGDPRNHSR